MRQGGRYLRAKPGAKAERVEWTRSPEETAAERRAAPAEGEKPVGGAKAGGADK